MNTTYGQFKILSNNRIIAFDVIECMIGVMGSATNMIVLLAIYKERKLRTITNCFVGSLAASDVLVGLVVPPLVILSNELLPINFKVCVFLNSLVVLFTNISVLNLLSVALERFVAIRKPFLYRRWMSTTRALYLVAATWLLAIFIGLVPLMGWHSEDEGYTECSFHRVISLEYLVYFIFFVVTLPPLVAMICIYFYIFRVVRKAKKLTRMLSTGLDHIKKTIKRNTRGDLSILLVIVLFILCWMPLHITNSILLFFDLKVPLELYLTCNTLSRFNSLVNPFLFAFGYSGFKLAIKRILFKRCINIKDDVNADKPEIYSITKGPPKLKVKKVMQYSLEQLNRNDYLFSIMNTAGQLSSLTPSLLEHIEPSTEESSLENVKTTLHPSDCPQTDEKSSSDESHLQEPEGLIRAHSLSDENICTCSLLDMIVCEDSVLGENARTESKTSNNKEHGKEKFKSREASLDSSNKTCNILDGLFIGTYSTTRTVDESVR